MSNFEISYKRLEKWEGGYSSVVNDRGGETYKGISRVYHPNNVIWKKIDELKNRGFTKLQINLEMSRDLEILKIVKDFYREEYWDKIKLDEIVYQDFACNLFLLSVNSGITRSIKIGQTSCNILVDGIMGSQTLKSFKQAGYKETENFTTIEIKYYESIVRSDETQRKFLNGWIKRAKEV